jgi:hypothetical protein
MKGMELLCIFYGKMLPPSFTLKMEAEVSPKPNYTASDARAVDSPTTNSSFSFFHFHLYV